MPSFYLENDRQWSQPTDISLGAYYDHSFEDLKHYLEDYLENQRPMTQPATNHELPPISNKLSRTWRSGVSSSDVYPISRGSSLTEGARLSSISSQSYQHRFPSSGSTSFFNSWSSDAISSSEPYLIQGGSGFPQTLPGSSSFMPLTKDNYTLLEDVNSSLNINNVATNVNTWIPYVPPEPIQFTIPPSSTSNKRPRSEEDNGISDNALIDASLYHKRRKLGSNHDIGLSDMPTPIVITTTTYNSITPAWSLQTSGGAATWAQVPIARASSFQKLPAFPGMSLAPSVYGPPAHVASTQPGQKHEGVINLTHELSGSAPDSYTSAKASDAIPWDPLSRLVFPHATNGPLDWEIGLRGLENSDVDASFELAHAMNMGAIPTIVPSFSTPKLNEMAYSNAIHTTASAHSATLSGVDFGQHSRTTHQMSTTEHIANANVPDACLPSTMEASSVELVGSHSKQSTFSPQPQSNTHAVTTGRRAFEDLWVRRDSSQYVCKYKGPAMPNGCSRVNSGFRNLLRHMRTHARKEVDMEVAEDQMIAFNWLPEKLRWIAVECPLDEKELKKCAHYRDTGARWRVVTMRRTDTILKRHLDRDHPPITTSKPKKKPKTKD